MIRLQTRTTHVLLLGLVWSIAAISLGAAKSLAQGVNVSTYVLEESEIGTSVVNLNNEIAYLQKQQQNGTGIVRPINVLRILDNSKFFYINDKSQLCVRERIDREALCTGDSAAEYRIVLLNDQCYIQLNIFVNYKQNTQNNDGSYSAAPEYTSGSFDTIPVYVMVRDVNDHYPEFTDDPLDAGFEIKVKEHVAIGTKFELPIASDADSGPNGELTYTVQLLVTNSSTGSSAQSINRIFSVENVREHEQANLIVLTDLDRETRAAYLLNLTVCDNGKPSRRCTSRKLTVTLVDMNDHAPTIVNASSYVVDVREDASVPLTLTKIEAIDNDDRDSQHGLLEFKIDASRSTAGASQQFAIDSATGNLRLISPLDREKLARHKVAVIVHDNPSDPSNSRSATCTVTVNVLDVNDQAPVIKVMPTSRKIDFGDYYSKTAYDTQDETGSLTRLYVMELNSPETVLALVTVTDADEGENGRVTCSIDDERNFRLSGTSGDYRLFTRHSLDFERENSYLIHIECIDSGVPVQRSGEPVLIYVVDRNDNPPRFNLSTSTSQPSTATTVFARASIEENNGVDAVVFRIGLADADTEVINLRHNLTVLEHADLFYVSNSTSPYVALLRASQSLDREVRSEYNVTITLSDQTCRCPPNVTSNSLLYLTITVTDVNDNVPVILTNNVTIDENVHYVNFTDPASSNDMLGKLVARDTDQGDNAELTFTMVSTEFDNPKVDVTPNGELFLVEGQFDREVATEYCMVVQVRDGGEPPLDSSSRVCIFVLDENDNAPVWTFPARGDDVVNVTLPESALNVEFKPTEIARLEATDRDSAANGLVQYVIRKGNELDNFQLEGNMLMLKRAPTFYDLNRYMVIKLVLEATDGGQPAQSTLAVLNVHFWVDNVNNIFASSFAKPRGMRPTSDMPSSLLHDADEVKAKESTNMTWIIIGGVIGAIVILAVLIGLLIHCHLVKTRSRVPKFTKNLRGGVSNRPHHSSFCTLCSSCLGSHAEATLEAGVSVIDQYARDRLRAQPHLETTAQITYRAESGDESESNCLVHNGMHKSMHLSTFRATASGSSYCDCASCQSLIINNGMQASASATCTAQQYSHSLRNTDTGRMSRREPVEADSLLSSQNQDMSENQQEADSQNENKLNLDSVSRIGSTQLNVANTPSDNNESGISIWETRRTLTLDELSRQKSEEIPRVNFGGHADVTGTKLDKERATERDPADSRAKTKKKKRPKILTVTATSKVAFSNVPGGKSPAPTALLCAQESVGSTSMKRSMTASPSANYFRFAAPGEHSADVSTVDSKRSSVAVTPNPEHRMTHSSHSAFGSPRYGHSHHFPVTPACECTLCNRLPETVEECHMNNLLMQMPETQLQCCQEAHEHFVAYAHNPHSTFHNYHRQLSPVSPSYNDAKRVNRPASVIGQLPNHAQSERNAMPAQAAIEKLEAGSGTAAAKHYQNPPYVTTSFV